MTKISEYYKKKNMVNRLAEELQKLEENEDLKSEMEFKEKLNDLMATYDRKAKDVVNVLSVLDPSIAKALGEDTEEHGSKGNTRPLQVYKNPHTGEVVETRSANQKTLKKWREQYGADTVRSWRQH